MRRTAILLTCLLWLGACSAPDESSGEAEASATPQVSLADACVRVAELSSTGAVSSEEYRAMTDDLDELISEADPTAVAALSTLRDAWSQRAEAEPGDEAVAALRQELTVLDGLAESCQAVGSPIG
ncbi:hypothetical protein QE370_000459 [Aeromicrobium sp. SORGH_AS981]|uniref:hypothetical protein n=1 Tax=Aeromicrobium sp. SORGH_AS_0981 TaxID=3041802 RepID=UPI00285D95D1|nr:hypothetical protein [Aeromicrobium sp. SORGH_AS_0981]MDR6117275.1 hypothetical protein [Aeromicrobium sp. SORGH_AS_0981]